MGPQTVANVVKRFKEKGLIEVRPNHGLFRGTQSAGDWPGIREVHVVGFGVGLAPNNRGFYNDELLCRLGEELTRRGLAIRMHQLPPAPTARDAEQLITSQHCSCCLTLALSREEVASVFESNHVSFVNLFPATPGVPPNSIVIDAVEVVTAQLEHLLELGHRRIGYLHSVEVEKFHRDLFFRREAFFRLVAERGLPLEPHWVQFGGYEAASVMAAMHRMLDGPKQPTAVIAADHQLGVIYHVLAERGLRAGVDFSVVGTDDLPIAAMVHPAATTMRVPRLGAVKMALATLKKIIKGEKIESTHTLPVRLIKRDSTCPPSPEGRSISGNIEGGAYEKNQDS